MEDMPQLVPEVGKGLKKARAETLGVLPVAMQHRRERPNIVDTTPVDDHGDIHGSSTITGPVAVIPLRQGLWPAGDP